jgi:hypothetical protein
VVHTGRDIPRSTRLALARWLLDGSRMKFPLVVVPILAVSACTDDPFEQKAATVEGIYRVDSHTRNETGCSPGGAAVEDTETFAFAKRYELLGIKVLDVISCSDIDDCRTRSEDGASGPLSFGFALTAVDGDTLTSVEVGSGFSTGGSTCEMPELAKLTLVMTDDTLQVERRTQIGADYMSANGACTTDQGRASAEAAPCSELETLTGTRLEDL